MAQAQVIQTGLKQQPGHYVIMKVVNSDQSDEDWKTNFPLKDIKYMSIGHLAAAGTAFVAQTVLVSFLQYPYMNAQSAGFWCGIFFATTGIIGLVNTANPRRFFNIAYVVLSAIAAIFAFTLLSMAIMSMPSIRRCIHDVAQYYERKASPDSQNYNRYDSYEIERCGTTPVVSALFCGVLVLVSIIEACLSTASTIISGRAACYKCGCCTQYEKVPDSSIVYTAQQLDESAINSAKNSAIVITSDGKSIPINQEVNLVSTPPPSYVEKEQPQF